MLYFSCFFLQLLHINKQFFYKVYIYSQTILKRLNFFFICICESNSKCTQLIKLFFFESFNRHQPSLPKYAFLSVVKWTHSSPTIYVFDVFMSLMHLEWFFFPSHKHARGVMWKLVERADVDLSVAVSHDDIRCPFPPCSSVFDTSHDLRLYNTNSHYLTENLLLTGVNCTPDLRGNVP